MSKENKAPADGNVAQMGKCVAEKCSQKSDKLGFCKEHYAWFKEGLLTREGTHPTDFDKKFQAFQHRNKPAA